MKTSIVRAPLTCALLSLAITLARLNAHAAVPTTMGYQGQIKVAGVPFNGNGQFKFAVIDRPTGASLWSNDGTSVKGGAPTAAVTLPVKDGLFTVLLGDSTLANMVPLDPSPFVGHGDTALRSWFNDGAKGWTQLADRPLASVPYALAAPTPNGSITGAQLAPGSIAPTHLSALNTPQAGRVLSYDIGGKFNWTDLSVVNNTWVRSGTSAYYNAGNVGIGTVNPVSKLDVRGYITLEAGGNPALMTGTGDAELNRYLLLFNSLGLTSASGLKAGGVLVSDSYDFANPSKSDLVVKGQVAIGTPTADAPLSIEAGDYNSTQLPNISLTGSKPTIRWEAPDAQLLGKTYTWLAHVGETHGLELWSKSQRLKPTGGLEETPWVNGVGFSHAGNINYLGQLNKLDVADEFTATVRAADLKLGHSSRRGQPGRALVDFKDTLHLNFASDWANTEIGGQSVSVCSLTIRGGCDLAEPFPMKEEEIQKGSVVVIDEEHPGRLKRSTQAYDTRVAGIVSGANGVNPGIALHQEGVMDQGQNVALTGRVYVLADAGFGSIKPGDLLTTSDTPGHAMKVGDHAKAQGAVLGKAMTGLKDGKAMVLVLVTLQ